MANRLISLLIILLGSGILFASQQLSSREKGLIALFHFENNLNDEKGYATATLTGGAYVTGSRGSKGLYTYGIAGDLLRISDAPLLSPANTPLTILLDVKGDANNNFLNTLFKTNEYKLESTGSYLKLTFYYNNGGETKVITGSKVIVTDQKPHRVGILHELGSAGSVGWLWVDGVLEGESEASTNAMDDTGNNLDLGNGGGSAFGHTYDELPIYNRVLSNAEMKNDYLKFKGRYKLQTNEN